VKDKMKLQKTKVDGLFILEYKPFKDLRGKLMKPFTTNYFSGTELNLDIKETWFTNSNKDVIRGMHLQVGEMACEKIVSLIQGEVVDVILDIRKESKTYGEFLEIVLTEDNPKMIYIPKGCAHGYKVIKDNSMVMYMATKVHSSDHDLGIHFNSFGYDWNIENPIISERDKLLPDFKEV